MTELLPILIPSFFVIAWIYSTAGFGGGSSYVALLLCLGVPFVVVPKLALLCNLVVVTGGTWHYWRAGHLSWSRTLPFIVSAIPMAYWGARLPVDRDIFQLLLAISLGIAACRLLLAQRPWATKRTLAWHNTWLVGVPVGALLGLLAGLVGIGGGIYLSPVLLLLGWADAKQAAASASLFILVNSVAGLAGQFSKGPLDIEVSSLVLLLLSVAVGGQVGSRLGAHWLPKKGLQRVTACLVLLVAARLLWSVI